MIVSAHSLTQYARMHCDGVGCFERRLPLHAERGDERQRLRMIGMLRKRLRLRLRKREYERRLRLRWREQDKGETTGRLRWGWPLFEKSAMGLAALTEVCDAVGCFDRGLRCGWLRWGGLLLKKSACERVLSRSACVLSE